MAQTRSGIIFGPYRLDVDDARLWRGNDPIGIQPRPLAILSYLAARPGEVVSRDELIATLWAGTHVTKAVLKVAVRAIREALDDDAGAPRYLETVGRDGYRFTGASAVCAPDCLHAGATAASVAMVRPRAGSGQAPCRTGSGDCRGPDHRVLGKTTLIDRFIEEVEPAGNVCVARGQCLEQYGEGEAYLPVLEALGRLVRDEGAG